MSFGSLFGSVGAGDFHGGSGSTFGTGGQAQTPAGGGGGFSSMGMLGAILGGGGKKDIPEQPGALRPDQLAPVTRVTPVSEETIVSRFPGADSLLTHSRNNIKLGTSVVAGDQEHSALTISVQEEALNGGAVTLIPTVWDGKILSQDEAVKRALESERQWPVFDDIDMADKISELLSDMMGQ